MLAAAARLLSPVALCVLLYADEFPVLSDLQHLFTRIKIEVCQDWRGSVIKVSAQPFQRVANETKDLRGWSEVAEYRLRVNAEKEGGTTP